MRISDWSSDVCSSDLQEFGEQSYQRSLPINEIGALLGGGGVQMPQFANFSQSTPFNAPDLLGASQASYNAQLGGYNSQQAQKGGLLGAGAQLGGSFLGRKSCLLQSRNSYVVRKVSV